MRRMMILTILLSGCGVAAPPKSAPTPKPVSQPPIAIKPGDLWNAYLANVINADTKYKGKPVELKGFVSKIGFERGKYTIGFFAAEGYEPGVIAVVDNKDAKPFAEIKADTEITITGICWGHEKHSGAWQNLRVVIIGSKLNKRH